MAGAAVATLVVARWCWFSPTLKNDRDYFEAAFAFLQTRYDLPVNTVDEMIAKFPRCCNLIRETIGCCWPFDGDTWTVGFYLEWPTGEYESYQVNINSCGIVMWTGSDFTIKENRLRR